MMDRHGRFLPAIPVAPVVALALIGACWLGYHAGREGTGAADEASSSRPVSRSTFDDGRPRLLPGCDIVRCANRLNPNEAAADGGDVTGWLGEGPSLNPPEIGDSPNETLRPIDSDSRPKDTSDEPCADVAGASQPPASTRVWTGASPGASASPWATPYRPGERSARLEQTARQADYHTRYGFDLASRKAYNAARAEFIRALRVVAQGLDSEHASQVHSRALSAGLAALEEVDDFVPAGSRLEGELDLDDVILGHATPVLKLADRERLAPVEAVRRYVEYAREQLAVAAGGEVAGSMALDALGKLHWSLADRQQSGRPIDDTKAVALFEAAVQVCPENYLALNDLGVLLARGGRYEAAREALTRSLAVSRDPTVEMNLAGVYRRLGDVSRARQAEREAAALLAAVGKAKPNSARPVPPVAWVSPQQFAGSYAATDGPWQPARAAAENAKSAPPAAEPPPEKQASRGGAFDWLLKTWK